MREQSTSEITISKKQQENVNQKILLYLNGAAQIPFNTTQGPAFEKFLHEVLKGNNLNTISFYTYSIYQQYVIYSMQHTVCNIKYSTYSMYHTVCTIQYVPYSM